MASSNEVADVLDAAADLYESERYDWCQGMAVSKDGLSICASQALCMACGMELVAQSCHIDECSMPDHVTTVNETAKFSSDLYQQAVETLNPDSSRWSLVGFNDEQGVGRTKQDIIDLFKNTAKGLRNGQ